MPTTTERLQRDEVWYCLDCDHFCLGDGGEYYMVHDAIWYRVTYGQECEGMLCIGCLEGRLGRGLTAADFTDCPLNHEKRERGSARLRDRLNRSAWKRQAEVSS